MAKSKGPYFEFFLQKNGANIEFLFSPGNSSKQVFNETKNALIALFDEQYGVNGKDFVREVTLEDGTPSIAIYQSKVLPVLRVILGTRAFSDFKIRVKGLDRNGEEKELRIFYKGDLEIGERKYKLYISNRNLNFLDKK